MDPGLETRVIKFVAENVGVKESKIGLQTTLIGLGVDADDAEEFILSYAKTFEVDLSEFNFMDHFGTEGFTFFQMLQFPWQLIRELRGEDPHIIANKIPIPIQDLIEAAEKKRWTPKVAAHNR